LPKCLCTFNIGARKLLSASYVSKLCQQFRSCLLFTMLLCQQVSYYSPSYYSPSYCSPSYYSPSYYSPSKLCQQVIAYCSPICSTQTAAVYEPVQKRHPRLTSQSTMTSTVDEPVHYDIHGSQASPLSHPQTTSQSTMRSTSQCTTTPTVDKPIHYDIHGRQASPL
jgi:hypothetical protein